MKEIIRAIVVFFSTLVFFYLCIAFVMWEIDASMWSEVTRLTFIWFGVGFAFTATIVSRGFHE